MVVAVFDKRDDDQQLTGQKGTVKLDLTTSNSKICSEKKVSVGTNALTFRMNPGHGEYIFQRGKFHISFFGPCVDEKVGQDAIYIPGLC